MTNDYESLYARYRKAAGLTQERAAELLGVAVRMLTVSEDTLDRLIRAGMLPVYRISAGITRLDREDVAAYMESRRQRATAIGRKSNKVKMVPEVYRGGKNNSGYVPGMKVV